jgi:hypothetical protein
MWKQVNIDFFCKCSGCNGKYYKCDCPYTNLINGIHYINNTDISTRKAAILKLFKSYANVGKYDDPGVAVAAIERSLKFYPEYTNIWNAIKVLL